MPPMTPHARLRSIALAATVALSFSADTYEANAKALLADTPFYEVETERRTGSVLVVDGGWTAQ